MYFLLALKEQFFKITFIKVKSSETWQIKKMYFFWNICGFVVQLGLYKELKKNAKKSNRKNVHPFYYSLPMWYHK